MSRRTKSEEKLLRNQKKSIHEIFDDEEKKKPFWITRAMAEDFSRRDVLYTTLREGTIYTIFILAVSMSTIVRRDSTMYDLTQAIKGRFLETSFKTANDKDCVFKHIRGPSDFFHYCENILMHAFYIEHYYSSIEPVAKAIKDDKKILYENLLLGVPRIRQVIVKNDSCEINEFFKMNIKKCFKPYHSSYEVHGSFGKGSGSAWVYSSPEKTKSLPYWGGVATYAGGGFYQDLGINRKQSSKIIKDLKENLWITRGTRAIFIDFSIYNANLNLFAVCKLVFERPASGSFQPSHSIHVLRFLQYTNKWDYVTFAFEILTYIQMFYYMLEEIREMIYFKFRYLLQFWSYIDLAIILMAFANMMTSLIVFPNAKGKIKEIRDNPDKYGNLEYLAGQKVLYNTFAAALFFVAQIKMFKYLNFNKTMGQLNNTLKSCALDITFFALMFFVIFFAYTFLGVLLFGSVLEDFSDWGIAMFTLLRTILGDFDYSQIEKANRILAPLYFLSYIFFVFFVLINMFLAIINDTYTDVKTEIAVAPDEMPMTDYIKDEFLKLLGKCGCIKNYEGFEKYEYNTVIREIREALVKCDFNDLEIEMFFARYNIDPLAEVGSFRASRIIEHINAVADEKAEENAVVRLCDFIEQQQRLDITERILERLIPRLRGLIEKVKALQTGKV